MKLELSGRTALVTGSSRGIGRAIAEVLHGEGCKVALNGRTAEDLAAAAADLPGAVAVAGDVTRPDDAQRIVAAGVEALGSLDILVCNVGGGHSVPPGDETYDDIYVSCGLRATLPQLLQQGLLDAKYKSGKKELDEEACQHVVDTLTNLSGFCEYKNQH